MKRLEQLITIARELSGNTRYDTDSGVSQNVFVQYFNTAQDSLLKQVVNLKSKYLLKTSDAISVVSGQETYSYPYDLYIQNIDTIRWSNNTSNAYFQTLSKCVPKEKVTSSLGFPYGYILEKDGYHLNPPINTGYLYLDYIQTLPRLQVKNGAVTAVTLNGSNVLSALTVSTSGAYSTAAINDDYYLCVVDKHGIQKARNIEYTSETAGVFTLSSQTLGDDQTIAVGDYITIGKNTSNLPSWPDICESFLIDFVVYSAKYGDSSKWSAEAKQYMTDAFLLLSGSFATPSDDLCEIPITNYDYSGF